LSYWLIKSEPNDFSIDDLKERSDKTEPWDGVRNYQARNFMRDDMRPGDEIFFYHSNCKVPGIVGIATVASEPYPDPKQFDSESKYFDPKSDPDDPRWILVDVKYQRHTRRVIPLAEIKENADALGDFALTRKGNRLSIMPVTETQWRFLLEMEDK